MHIPEGFINNQVSISFIAVSAAVVLHALKQAKNSLFEKVKICSPQLVTDIGVLNYRHVFTKIRLRLGAKNKWQQMVLVACVIFTGQMIDFVIPNIGTVHLIGGFLAALVLGPWLGVAVMSAVLGIQAVFLADGGIIALGANIFNMGIVTSVGGYYLYKLIKNLFKKKYITIILVSWASVVVAAIFYSFEAAISNVVPLSIVLPAMVSTHAIGGLLEAVITILALKYLFDECEI